MEQLSGCLAQGNSRSRIAPFALVVGMLVLLRGLMVISVLPPLEGWDEYQHVAYVQFVSENGRAPLIGRDHVPQSVLDSIADVPQPRHAVEQLGEGAVGYDEFWRGTRAPRPAKSEDTALYQAQHPPVYYFLVQPLWRATGGVKELSASIAALRLVNVGLMALAAGLLTIALSLIFDDRRLAAAAGLLLGLHPLFLLAGARVSNDALGIALGAGGLACLVAYFRPNRPLLWAGAAGLLLAASICARATCLPLLPAAGAAVGWLLLRRRSLREWLGTALFILAAGAALTPLLLFNLSHYGMLLASAEAMDNASLQRTWGDLWAAAMTVNWPVTLYIWFGSFWIGGWSFLRAPLASTILWTAASLGLCGGLCLTLVHQKLRRRLMEVARRNAGGLAFSMALIGSFAAGMVGHTVIARAASGSLSNPWYAALAIPFTLAVVLTVLRAWFPADRVNWVTLAIAAFLLGTELYCTFVAMPRAYGGDAGLAVNLHRVSTLQPPWLGPWMPITAAAGACGLACWLVRHDEYIPKHATRLDHAQNGETDAM